MKKPTLEQVIKLAAQLSPEDRQEVFLFIAQQPDSAIKTSVQALLPLSPAEKKKFDEAAKTDRIYLLASDDGNTVKVFQRGRLIFQVSFNPQNFLHSRMQGFPVILKDAVSETESILSETRRALEFMGRTDVTKDELEDRNRQIMHETYKKQTVELADDVTRLLPTFAWLLGEAGINIAEFGNRNKAFAERGFPKYKLEVAMKMLAPYWRRIKDLLYLQPGGRINVRHQWSKADYLCLKHHHERLKPIWKEAKRIAREARNSNETTRRTRWKDAVTGTYGSENLPDDLIDHLTLPDEWPPSDLALVHAGRLCVPNVSPPYSLKVLKEKLKLSKLK
jgi:hypothetical protein